MMSCGARCASQAAWGPSGGKCSVQPYGTLFWSQGAFVKATGLWLPCSTPIDGNSQSLQSNSPFNPTAVQRGPTQDGELLVVECVDLGQAGQVGGGGCGDGGDGNGTPGRQLAACGQQNSTIRCPGLGSPNCWGACTAQPSGWVRVEERGNWGLPPTSAPGVEV